jgi:two-component system LytT family response regulator
MIVDDEPLARAMIRMHLSRCPGWKIAGECINAIEAYALLHSTEIQVMFLDIRMPHIMGNEFLRSLKTPPLVIFTTAHAEHAIEGFELNAIDYLLKPVTFDRFIQAIDKTERQLNLLAAGDRDRKPSSGAGLVPATLCEEPSPVTPVLKEDFIFIRQGDRQVKVSYNEILFLEAKRDFTKLYLKNKILMAGFHLKMLEDMLPASLFMRVHRSYMVALSAISAVYGNTIEIGGHSIPVSANYKDILSKALKLR